MTAPSSFVVSGTYYHPDGTLAPLGSTVEFKAVDTRFKNNGNVVVHQITVAALSSGVLSQTLVQATNGYWVTEKIVGLDGNVRARTPYTIAGTANLNLGT